jgi:uncharacterized protein
MALNRKLAGWTALVGTVSLLGYLQRFLAGKPPKNVVYDYGTAASELVLFAVILAIVLWIARGLPKRETFALRRPRSWGSAVGVAFGVFITILVVSYALNPLLHAGREQGLTPSKWESAHAGAFAANLVALAVVGPIVEELTFRGLGFGLLSKYGVRVALVGTAVLFGLVHGFLVALPLFVIVGLALGWLRMRSGSVYPGMVMHGLFNAAVTVAAISLG